MEEFENKSLNLDLQEIIKRCPRGFLETLVELLKEARKEYNANERELTIAASVLIENRINDNERSVKSPMETKKALEEIHSLFF